MVIQKVTGRTLKTRRILFRANIQIMIASLSLLLWKYREIAFCLPRFTVFLWISARIL